MRPGLLFCLKTPAILAVRLVRNGACASTLGRLPQMAEHFKDCYYFAFDIHRLWPLKHQPSI
jgi:hypothetical protein